MRRGTPRRRNLAGRRFGRLVVQSFADVATSGGARWVCQCDCGKQCVVRAATLVKPNGTLSCGCYAAEQTSKRSAKPFNDHEFIDDSTVAVFLAAMQDGVRARVLIDAADLPLVSSYRWWADGGRTRIRYAVTLDRDTHKPVHMHNVIMAEALAAAPGHEVDHVSRDGLDNRRMNLRIATKLQNAMNKGKTTLNTSGYKGVMWSGEHGRWRVRSQGKHIGYYDDVVVAARAYDEVVYARFGVFAVLNFPDEVK